MTKLSYVYHVPQITFILKAYMVIALVGFTLTNEWISIFYSRRDYPKTFIAKYCMV